MREAVVKLHKDWIQELYYKELVGLTTKEKTHDENGRTISANIYDSNIILNSGQIDALFNSNRALLDIKMNSYDNENTAVKLYTDYQFKIAVGAILELNIEE